MNELWIVGKYVESRPWEFQGVFDDERKAVSACKSADYFVAPVTLNAEVPEQTQEWPGVYYPLVNDGTADGR